MCKEVKLFDPVKRSDVLPSHVELQDRTLVGIVMLSILFIYNRYFSFSTGAWRFLATFSTFHKFEEGI